jgi:transcriptional regulator with XRE-family HTH domain
MEKQAISQRLREFMELKKLTQKDLADSLGTVQAVVSAILLGKQKVNNWVEKLKDVHHINPSWLLFGEGEMFLPEGNVIEAPIPKEQSPEQRVKRLRNLKNLSQIEVAEQLGISEKTYRSYEIRMPKNPLKLRQIANFFNTDEDYILYGTVPQIVPINDFEKDFIVLPLLACNALASFTENSLKTRNNIHSQTTFPVYRNKTTNYENACVVEVDGDSMEPKYPRGCKVLVRPVSDGNWQYSTGVHIISLKSEMVLLKRIIENRDNVLRIKSDNPSKPDELTVQVADIQCMFKVMEIVWSPAE